MNKDEALKMAIDYLLSHQNYNNPSLKNKVIDACKEALEQPAQIYPNGDSLEWNLSRPQPAQEPVAWMEVKEKAGYKDVSVWAEPISDKSIPLYTHPHQWQGLTDDEIKELIYDTNNYIEYAHAIEQALKDKNK